MEEIKIQRAAKLKEKPDPKTLGFGKIFSDHMFLLDSLSEESPSRRQAGTTPASFLLAAPLCWTLRHGVPLCPGGL